MPVEGALLEFTVTATNSKGTELELLFNTQGLPQDLQNNISTATFNWTPDVSSQDVYYPVVFVARDPLSSRCAYQAITITVQGPLWVEPGDSIQDAVDNPLSNGTIYVANGIY